MTDQKIRTFPCFTDVAVVVSAGRWLHCLTVLFIDVLTVLFIDVLGYLYMFSTGELTWS